MPRRVILVGLFGALWVCAGAALAADQVPPVDAGAAADNVPPAGPPQGGAKPLALAPDADLQGDAAPRVALRPFALRVELKTPGTEGVLAAQGGQVNGWALLIRDGEIRFVMNRDSRREYLTAPRKPGKWIEAGIGPQGVARLSVEGQVVATRVFPGLLPSQPVDGLQVGRDLASPVGDYPVPFAFDGLVASATLEVGEEQPAPPFVGAVPAGGPVPRMEPPEQRQHPLPGRDRFGGDLRVIRKATGFFRTEQVGGRWCFITPEGHPFIALGANHTGPTLRHQGRESGLWARFNYDPDQAVRGMLQTLHGLGFTAGDVYQPDSAYTRTLPWITFFWYGPDNQSFVDVFDAAQMAEVRARVLAHAESVADNPWVLGLGGPDLSIWDAKLVRKYRELPPQAPGRRRYVAFLRERYADDIEQFNRVYGTQFASFDALHEPVRLAFPADAEEDRLDAWTRRWKLPVPPERAANPPLQADHDAFGALVAETLFPVVRGACKQGAPQHLFLGEHLAVRMVPDAVLRVMGKYVDAYLAQAVEVSPQRPPEWQVFQRDRWDHEYALLQKPIVIVDWGAVFSLGPPFDYQGATIKPEREASDDAAQFIADAFDAPYIVGLFVCKLWGDHRNDTNFFNDRATRTYLRNDGTPYAYRTERLRDANFRAQQRVFDEIYRAGQSPE